MEIVKTQKGFLTILSGKTGMGKSTITVYDAAEALKEGENVIFFSFEYCQSIVYNKLVAHFGLKWQQLYNLNVVDGSYLGLNQMVSYITNKKGHVDAVYVDYLDLVQANTYADSELSPIDQIKEIVATLAKLAKELDIKIVLLTQTGSENGIDDNVKMLNSFTSGLKEEGSIIKMLIEKGGAVDSKIIQDDISHLILLEGNSMRYFSTINFKEVYKY